MGSLNPKVIVESPQRYDLHGAPLAAVAPPMRPLPSGSPGCYFRRTRRAGVSEAHTVSLPPATAKPPSVRKEGLVVLMVGGAMETRVEGHPLHHCGPLSITYHPAGQAGTGSVGHEGARMLVLSLPASECQALQANGLAAQTWRPMDSPILALKAFREFLIGDAESALAIEEITMSLFAASAQSDWAFAQRPRWWKRLRDCLAEDEPQKSLSELAAAVGVHPVHLCATYRQLEGKTIGEARRERKIARACRMILDSTWSLGDISHELGYSDQSHFVRAFRRTLGFNPSALRSFQTGCDSQLTLSR